MNTVLFDLDGTLLPMDQQAFTDTYFKALSGRFRHSDYDSIKIVDAIWQGTKAMIANDGFRTNEEIFWHTFRNEYTPGGRRLDKAEIKKIERILMKFYKKDFAVTRLNTWPTPYAWECISTLKNKGYQVVVATNPFFPDVATRQRIEWAGLNPDDFSLITTYENSCFCKPNLNYYRHVLKMLDKDPVDCIVVGNDVEEDMCAMELGIDVFLIDECLINNDNEDISMIKRGDWKTFKEFVDSLPNLN